MEIHRNHGVLSSILDVILLKLQKKREAQVAKAQKAYFERLAAQHSSRMRSLTLELLNDNRCPAYSHAEETKTRIKSEVDSELDLAAGR